jgi:hypothetical protein
VLFITNTSIYVLAEPVIIQQQKQTAAEVRTRQIILKTYHSPHKRRLQLDMKSKQLFSNFNLFWIRGSHSGDYEALSSEMYCGVFRLKYKDVREEQTATISSVGEYATLPASFCLDCSSIVKSEIRRYKSECSKECRLLGCYAVWLL